MTETPLVGIHDLRWPPGEEDPLFDGVDFEIHAGERIALHGPSGAGKSSLLRCLVALEPRASGAIYWRSERVEPSSTPRFRRRVHYVHQQPVAVAPTVADNLQFARETAEADDETDPLPADRRDELLERLDVGADIDASRQFDALSVGEQQRVALVRSLTVRPAVLLLDEPTAALDEERAETVSRLVDDYVGRRETERALVWVGHDRAQADSLATRSIDVQDLTSSSDA